MMRYLMIIANWRKASPNICKLWRNAEAAARAAIEERRTIKTETWPEFFLY